MTAQKAYYPIMINYLDHLIRYKTRETSDKFLEVRFGVLSQDTDICGYHIIIHRLQWEYDAQEEEDIIDAIVDRIKLDNHLTGNSKYHYRMETDCWEVHIAPNKEV